MARLLDDLLDLSRITRNLVELKREPVELHAIVNAAVENARQMAEERHHRLETDIDEGPLWVHGVVPAAKRKKFVCVEFLSDHNIWEVGAEPT